MTKETTRKKVTVEEVASKIRETIANNIGIAPCAMTDDRTFENMGMDLLDITELEIDIETEYGIYIYDNIDPTMTLKNAAEEIAEVVNGKGERT